MRVRQLSPTGDFTFGNGLQNFFINSPQGVAQVVQTSLLLWLGEWYLDQTLGMQWLQGVLGKHNETTADAVVQAYISNVEGVADIASFQSSDNQSDRNYLANVTIDTIYGPVDVTASNEALY